MQAVYESAKTVEEIVRAGLEAAAEFDSSSSGPFETHSVDLAVKAKPRAAKKSAPRKAARPKKRTPKREVDVAQGAARAHVGRRGKR